MEGCLVAAYAAFHPEGSRKPDLKSAEKFYRAGCEQKHAYSCFALGYIEKLNSSTDPEAIAHLQIACSALERKLTNACWTLHLNPQLVPDPRHNPGDWESYVKPEKEATRAFGDAGGGGLFAMSPGDGTPVYLEGSIQFGFGNPRVQFDLGFALLRLRALSQRRESVDEKDWDFHIGSGIDLGIRVRPFERYPLWLRTSLRMTAYYSARSSFSFVGTLAYPIKGSHRLEAGVLLDNLPLRYERVDVFDDRRTIEDYFWRPLLVVRYTYAKDM